MDTDTKRELLRQLLARRASEPRRYPASFAQERLWFLDRLVPGNPFYNVEAAIPIEAALRPDILERAVNEIVRRHGTLRTTFGDDGDGPVQIVSPELHVPLQVVDLRTLPADDQADTVMDIRRERARTAFDLTQGPLIITDLLQLGDQRWLFLLHMHHIIADGWSMGIFSKELSLLYEAFLTDQPSPLPALTLQYGDFAAWQRRNLSGDALATQLAYWRDKLAGITPLDLPLDHPRPAVQSHRGGFHTHHLSPELTQAVHAFGRQTGATPFMTLLAAFKVLLARTTGSEDVAVGTYIAGRDREELEPLIGFFLNTLVLRTAVPMDEDFSTIVARVKDTALDAYTHQALPFATLVKELSPERDLSRNALVQVVFQLQNADAGDAENGAEALIDYQRGAAIFDIAVTCHEAHGRLHATWEYCTDLFEPSSIDMMASRFEHLLGGALAQPRVPVWQLPMMDEPMLHRVLLEWNAARVPYPDTSVSALLSERAQAVPDAVAFIDGDQALTLAELDQCSAVLARRLRSAGIGPGDVCGVCMARGLALPVALFAVWRAGAVYLPLDPHYPFERLSYMVRDSGAKLLLGMPGDDGAMPGHAGGDAEGGMAARLADAAGLQLVLADLRSIPPDALADAEDAPGLPPAPGIDAISHILYTSGSTGRPKPAPSTHRQILNRLHWMWRQVPFGPDEVGCVKTAISFIDSLWELLGTALQGRPSVLIPQALLLDPGRLVDLLARHRVSRLWLVPSYLRVLLDTVPDIAGRLSHLRCWVSSGEVLPVELQARFDALLPDATLFNLYGTSEVWDATWHDPRGQSAAGTARVPIGRPIDNVTCFVLDPRNQPVPPGVVGELHVGGDALGALEDSPRCKRLALAGQSRRNVWACGDLVRWRHDGELEFFGRRDAELKVRGMRVEPAEIEAVLATHPDVACAAVLAWPSDAGPRLVAYVAPRAGRQPDEMAWRRFMAERVPAFMLPDQIVPLAQLPHTGSGKIDRMALQRQGDPREAVVAARPGQAPRNDTEAVIAEVWRELLGRDVGVDDNFFAVGGHSLLAAQVISRLQQRLGRGIELRKFFESPTIASFAMALDAPDDETAVAFEAIPRAARRPLKR